MSTSPFDEKAKNWDNPLQKEINRKIGAAITAHIPLSPESVIIDFGAGTGLLSMELAPAVKEVMAIDDSIEMLSRLKVNCSASAVGNITPMHGKAEDLLPNLKWDILVSSLTLHHVKNAAALLSQIYDGTSSDGWIAIADLDHEDGSFHGNNPDVHHHGFSASSISTMLKNAGFSDISVEVVGEIEREKEGKTKSFKVICAFGRKG